MSQSQNSFQFMEEHDAILHVARNPYEVIGLENFYCRRDGELFGGFKQGSYHVDSAFRAGMFLDVHA